MGVVCCLLRCLEVDDGGPWWGGGLGGGCSRGRIRDPVLSARSVVKALED